MKRVRPREEAGQFNMAIVDHGAFRARVMSVTDASVVLHGCTCVVLRGAENMVTACVRVLRSSCHAVAALDTLRTNFTMRKLWPSWPVLAGTGHRGRCEWRELLEVGGSWGTGGRSE